MWKITFKIIMAMYDDDDDADDVDINQDGDDNN